MASSTTVKSRLVALAGVALAATAGVWWGQRREAATAGSTRSSLGGDAST